MIEISWLMTQLLAALVLLSVALVVYHYAFYPVVLQVIARRGRRGLDEVPVRCWSITESDPSLPTVAILTPAYNEARVIADKVRNVAALDYPADRLRLVIVCDGCTDATAEIARAASLEPECRHLRVDIIEFASNEGKVARINGSVPLVASDIICLSDASALISIDALLIAAHHFSDPAVGAVCATYKLISPDNAGEAMYWEYQTRIKECEAWLGGSIGAHGACYFFRRRLFLPLPADTINDDFILPMTIVAEGYRSVYDPRIVALEVETTRPEHDYRRRKRIAAGNIQQVLRLRKLFGSRYGGTAFVFASGKGLRSLVPFLLLFIFVTTAFLGEVSSLFTVMFVAQLVLYSLAFVPDVFPGQRSPRLLATLRYLVKGQLAALVGGSRYVLGLERATWRNAKAPSNPELRTMRRFNEHLARLGGVPSIKKKRARPSMQILMTHTHPVVRYGKRGFDLIVSLLLLVAASPLFALVAIVIKIDTSGSIFFHQLRIGESRSDYTRLFHVVKFRSMHSDAEAGTGAVWATEDDPRVTRVGRFLRRTRLDELPQLINVVRGEMSLIGPRPERPGFFASLDRSIPYYGERVYGIKPGITGFSQVVNRTDLSIDDVKVKLYYDHAYALTLSQPAAWLSLDLWIIARTILLMTLGPEMLTRRRPPCIHIVKAAAEGSDVALSAATVAPGDKTWT
jgi:lipopolysaccharide/colanic/teichoic acid biosynthesis glycosyltransferase/cellulose synthase/poly-beta-1,6-N-acetylglucosamine synthase-like glycosyltransferase